MARILNDDGGGGGGSNTDAIWIDVNWSFTEPLPQGLLQGFDVVVYTGATPNDTSSLVLPVTRVAAGDRRHVALVELVKGTAAPAMKAAVRTVYPQGLGAWTTVASSSTPTLPNLAAVGTDNLIPNPTSELGLAMQGYGSALVVNDSTNAYAGNWCRKLNASATNQTNLTPLIPCVYGDQFSYDCYVKGSSGTPNLALVLTFYDASGTSVGTSSSAAYTGGPAYVPLKVQGTVPATAVSVRASVKASVTAAGAFLYFDNLSLRRSVRFRHLEGDAGFRGLNAVANTGVTPADRVYIRGNNDPSVNGGAPNINTLTVTRRRWDSVNKTGRLDLKLQPGAAADNLDAMRPAKVAWYRQNCPYAGQVSGQNLSVTFGASNSTYNRTTGSFVTDGHQIGGTFTAAGFSNAGNNGTFTITGVSTLSLTVATTTQVTEASAAGRTITSAPAITAVDTTYPHIGDRQYLSSTDSNAANASLNTAQVQDSGVSGGVPAAVITLYNVLGPSDSNCFYTATGNGDSDGTTLLNAGQNFPASFNTGGAAGAAGGGGGGGGSCPTPETLIDLPGGRQKRADELQPGDLVWTIHQTGTIGAWPVLAATMSSAPAIFEVIFDDGLRLRFARNHRLRLDGAGWCEVQDLQAGDVVTGEHPRVVASVAELPGGPVVAITIDEAHAYQTSGLLNSNIKAL